MSVTTTKELIEETLGRTYGEDIEFGLLEFGRKEYLLVTPFVDNENNLIELNIKILDSGKVVVTDSGRAIAYVRKLFPPHLNCCHSFYEYDLPLNWIGKVREHFKIEGDLKNRMEAQTDFDQLGRVVAELLRLLQKIYSLPLMRKDKEEKFTICLREHLREEVGKYQDYKVRITEFKGEVRKFITELNLKYVEDFEVRGISGDVKVFDFMIPGRITKLIKIVSANNTPQAIDLIKICHSDFSDLRLFRRSFCIVVDDRTNPWVWLELKKKGTLKILNTRRVLLISYYREAEKFKKYILK